MIPFRTSSAFLLLSTILAACGGGGEGPAADVVAAAGASPIHAAPVSTGVLTQPPAVVLPAASTEAAAATPAAIEAPLAATSDVAAPGDIAPVAVAVPLVPVPMVVPVVAAPAVVPTVTPVVVATSTVAPATTVTTVSPVAPAGPVTSSTPVPANSSTTPTSATTTPPSTTTVPTTTIPTTTTPTTTTPTTITPTTPTTPPPATTTSTLTWVVCASEGYVCSFSGSALVRYGTATTYYERLLTEQTPCDNATFGDPASWQAKQCSVLVSVVTSSAPRARAALGVYLGAEAGGVAKVDGYAAWLGRRPDRALEFLSNDSWAHIEAAASRDAWLWTPTQLGMTFSVPMLPGDHSSTMAAGARGDYDHHFRTIAANFVRDGQPNAIVRIGWEFNYGWYPWAAGANVQDFVAYWRRIVTAMRSVPGANFRFDWCPAIGQGDLDIAKAYPGDAYVDIIGLDVYNQTWANPVPSSDALWQTLLTQPFGLQWHRNFGLTHGKPISYPEWGTGTRPDGHGMGDDPRFIEHMAAWIADNDVVYHDYWDYQAPDYDAKLSEGNFPMAGAAFRTAFGR